MLHVQEGVQVHISKKIKLITDLKVNRFFSKILTASMMIIDIRTFLL